MKVFVVYDKLCEQIISVHRTRLGADKGCVAYNEKEGRQGFEEDYLEFDEYELED